MTTYPALREANQWRSIRANCLPLFELAHGIPETWQESIYRTMVLRIAATLDVEATAHDLNLDPRWVPIRGVGRVFTQSDDDIVWGTEWHGTEWLDFLRAAA